jgi:hypothetical protein
MQEAVKVLSNYTLLEKKIHRILCFVVILQPIIFTQEAARYLSIIHTRKKKSIEYFAL